MALIDKITEAVVKVPLESRTKPEVLKELLHVLAASGRVINEDSVYSALLERENQGSTGLQDGIAVPHTKTAAVDDLQIAIGIAPDGIDFQALDGAPSRVFFLILAAPSQSGLHLEALSEIAGMARSAAFIRALANAPTPQDVVKLIRE
jgi:mannitol/fructose-specific phosphotransferase system IIA component (Ntr-type)